MLRSMRIVPNPVKEARNRAKHGWDFGRVREILANPTVEEVDDRPFGYEHEGRIRLFGRLGTRVVLFVLEPVKTGSGELAVRPISLRNATPGEQRVYWERLR